MTHEPSVPILFTVDGTTRHEVILVSPAHATLPSLSAAMARLAAASPNCGEFMAHYKKKGSGDPPGVEEIRVRWDARSHDPKIFPASTVVTEDNLRAVVEMIGRSGVGRDTLEVRLTKEEPHTEG
jgi:hypothetical protein